MKRIRMLIQSLVPQFTVKKGLLLTLISMTTLLLISAASIAFSFTTASKKIINNKIIWNTIGQAAQNLSSVIFTVNKPSGSEPTPTSIPGMNAQVFTTVSPMPGASSNATPIPTLPPGVNALITVSNTTTKTIPSDFAGISFESSSLCSIFNLDAGSSSFSQLFKNLGSAVLRIGGNSADFTSWSPNGTFSCNSTSTVVTKTMINTFITFLQKINWSTIWSLNLSANDPTTFADEASYIISTGGSNLLALAIGNEPDLYHNNGNRSSSYVYTNFKPEWESYLSSIHGISPSAAIEGPDTCCNNPWLSSFMTDESTNLTFASQHYYPTKSTGTGPTAPTITNLLSASLMSNTASAIDTWISYANTNNLSFVLTETNSTSGGGTTGLSNTFASTLWAIDYMFTAAEHGVRRMNFHGLGGASYAVINGSGNPNPIYYAFLLFNKAASGNTIVNTTVQSNIDIASHTTTAGGKLYVTILNKDQVQTATVQLKTPISYNTASEQILTAPSITSTSGVTFAGSSVASDGTWTPISSQVITLNGSVASLTLAPASAAVITLQ